MRWTRGVQVKLWDALRMRAIPEGLTGVFTTRRYTNSRLPNLTLPYLTYVTMIHCYMFLVPGVSCWACDRPTWRTIDWLSRLSRCLSTDYLEYTWSTCQSTSDEMCAFLPLCNNTRCVCCNCRVFLNYDNRCSAILIMMSAVRIRNLEIIQAVSLLMNKSTSNSNSPH